MEIQPRDMEEGDKSPESKDLLTSQTASTLCISSRSESGWSAPPQNKWDVYHKPVIVLSVGGAVFLFGVAITSLTCLTMDQNKTMENSTTTDKKTTKEIFKLCGPAFLSLGLMLLVCGLVWIPIIRKKLRQKQKYHILQSIKSFFLNR
ncbi:phosphoinositide-interacting protein [Sceloporus undulatus]|uniref:phosphoinositide-interacting protein n=1 Tax=Sceloporus undulatus TaxID=8520 RepID=UPI001C4D90B0|nr:phosphoinositide-interacting protein [Sceloporus undulatus]